MTAYYNEIDPFAAAWLRELIRRGAIAPGDVDERSIEDVTPAELAGYTQCHFFAGIGVWSYALRLAGVPDDYPLWTGSCPCQPFSAAGKGKGTADERHLWPSWFHLIEQCGPASILGEQVASRDGLSWFDLVSSDLEALDYACGTAPAPAAGFGAPHIRERNFWVAHAGRERRDGVNALLRAAIAGWVARAVPETARGGPIGGLGHAHDARPQVGRDGSDEQLRSEGRQAAERPFGLPRLAGGLAHADSGERSRVSVLRGAERDGYGAGWPKSGGGAAACGVTGRPGPTNGLWRDADWLGCRDGKWRPVEPGTFPLVDGAPARVGRLRGYGNAIVAEQAAAFVEAALDFRLTEGIFE